MSKYNVEVIDDFLPKEVAEEISNYMIGRGAQFPWFYNNSVVSFDKPEEEHINNHQFTHIFYSDWSPKPYFNLIEPLTMKLNPISWQRIKANLNPVTSEKVEYPFHTDYQTKQFAKTAIYYLNTNNGVTIFDDGSKIESVFNRMIIFDQNIMHTGTTCTDQKVRSVINFNFIDRI